ncbi:MAG TPA: tetratricopeptide repeat protein [Blastocatellia bacterium]|nr:tetratricopeptide repeat protein [Blastocatellia bacterium]
MRDVSRLLFLLLITVRAFAGGQGFEQTRDLIRRGEFAAAAKACDETLKRRPRDFQVWTLKGIALQGLGRNAESLESFRRALAIQPQFLPALQGAAQLEYQTHDPRGRETLEAILRLRPEPTAHAMLGVLAFERQDCHAALGHFAAAGAAAGDPVIKWQRASCHYRLEQWGEAEAQFRELLALRDDDRVRYNLGLAQLGGGKAADAVATLELLGRGDRPDPDALSLLAAAHEANKQTPEALRALRRAIDLYPREERLYADLATICLEHGALELGREVLEAGAKNVPQSARIQAMLGVLHARAGQAEEAQEAFRRAERLAPDAAIGRVGLAVSLMEVGAFEQAIALLREQAGRAPGDPRVDLTLARALLQRDTTPEELGEAEALLRRVIGREPGNAAAYALLGKARLRAGDAAAAAAALEKAIGLDPRDGAATYQLMLAYRRLGRSRDAAALQEKARQLVDAERAAEAEAGRYRLFRVPEGRPGQ